MKYAPTVSPFFKPVRSTQFSAGTDVCLQSKLIFPRIQENSIVSSSGVDGMTYRRIVQSLYRPTYKIDLGFKAVVPEGYVALALPRSGMACKGGLVLRNSVGVIDIDYRGNWFLYMYRDAITDIVDAQTGDNISGVEAKAEARNEIVLDAGTRIAQVVIVPAYMLDWEETELSEIENDITERGEGGFGHTG